MTLSLPSSVSTYFEVSNGADASQLADSFTHDAVVTDEKQTYRGYDAIEAWKHEARNKFDYSIEPVAASRDGNRLTVRAKVVGNFPGSPVQLDHVFDLAGDKIEALEIY